MTYTPAIRACLAGALVVVLWLTPLCVVLGQDEDSYTRRATWQETVQASLQTLAAAEDREREEARGADENGLSLGPWYAIGSFDNTDGKGFAAQYPPEAGIDLAAEYSGQKDSKAAWRKMAMFQDGQVHDLLPHFGLTEWAIVYLYRDIQAEHDVEITGYFGSDDGLAVWLNGEELISNDVPRGPAPDQDKAQLRLKRGSNQLLMKIVNRTGGFGFYFSTKPGGGNPEDNPVHVRRVNAIWARVAEDFGDVEARREMDNERSDGIWPLGWDPSDEAALQRRYDESRGAHLAKAEEVVAGLAADLGAEAVGPQTDRLQALRGATAQDTAGKRAAYHEALCLQDVLVGMARIVSTRMAVEDLRTSYPEQFGNAPDLLARLADLDAGGRALAQSRPAAEKLAAWEAAVLAVQRQALVAQNPLLGQDKLLFLVRRPGGGTPGLPQNWQGNSSIARMGYDTGICTVEMAALRRAAASDGVPNLADLADAISTVYHSDGAFVGDMCLSFDARRLLFSMPDEGNNQRFEVWEIGVDGDGLRLVTSGCDGDYDNYDACYLPNGEVMFVSTRCYQAVPCTGGDHVGLLYVSDADGGNARQLTFDQDHSWNPTVLNDGRIVYTRWEYNDTPHYFSRILFGMNPDGTRQMALYGSNSYFPNTTMYAQPIPGSDTKVVAILSGHHGNPRMGEVAIIDTSEGEREADGVVRILPERHRKIEPVIVDQYATGKWPQFVQPHPLSDKYFLVSCKPEPSGSWGLYLVDVFDNLVPLMIEPSAALMEPIVLRPRPTPPSIPPAVDLTRDDAYVYLFDVYRGRGLEGVPRGTVKKLRLVEPIYRYWGNGNTHTCAIDGTWDVKRILGTVPVAEDGSAYFRVPANTPIMVQPLNDQNMAQQHMRSWFTAMPGEALSCVGCHENRRDVVNVGQRTTAQAAGPVDITPWYGEPRGFSFEAEVQPVLDRACVRCHSKGDLDMRGRTAANWTEPWSPAYNALHPYVRRPGLESDIRLLPPREFEANTSQLVQMLKKGHFGVKLSEEDWDRIITWIDLNVPFAGNWKDAYPPAPDNLIERREELRAQDAAVIARQKRADAR